MLIIEMLPNLHQPSVTGNAISFLLGQEDLQQGRPPGIFIILCRILVYIYIIQCIIHNYVLFSFFHPAFYFSLPLFILPSYSHCLSLLHRYTTSRSLLKIAIFERYVLYRPQNRHGPMILGKEI